MCLSPDEISWPNAACLSVSVVRIDRMGKRCSIESIEQFRQDPNKSGWNCLITSLLSKFLPLVLGDTTAVIFLKSVVTRNLKLSTSGASGDLSDSKFGPCEQSFDQKNSAACWYRSLSMSRNKCRMLFLRHVDRVHEDEVCQTKCVERNKVLQDWRRPCYLPKTSWTRVVEKDLVNINVDLYTTSKSSPLS